MVLAAGLVLFASACKAEPESPSIEMQQLRTMRLPSGFPATGASFTSGGRVVVWSATAPGFTISDADSFSKVRRLDGDPVLLVEIAAGVAGTDRVYRASGIIEDFEATDSSINSHHRIVVPPSSTLPTVLRSGDAIWFAASDSVGVVAVSAGKSLRWGADVAPGEQLVFGSFQGDLLVQEFLAPHRLLRLAMTGAGTPGKVRWQAAPPHLRGRATDWRGLRPIALGSGLLLQTIANVVDDTRTIALIRGDGSVLASTQLAQPVAFHDADTVRHILLGLRRRGAADEVLLVQYRFTKQSPQVNP